MGVTGVAASRPSRFADDRMASVEQRMESLFARWTPYLGLAIGVAATPLIVKDDTWVWSGVLPLTVALAAWAWWFVGTTPMRAEGRIGGPVYVTGLLGLMAPLVWFSPIFGFLAVAAYSAAFGFLPRRWRYVGLFVASAIVSYTYLGGRFAEVTTLMVIGYGVLVVVNMGVAGLFTWYGNFTSELASTRRAIIEELDEANARLSAALDENAALHAQLLVAAREAGVRDERARMAREIHDTIAQGLTGIVAQLEAADVAEAEPEVRRRHVDTARGLARESLAEARRSVAALAPTRLAEARLPDAIAEMAKSWAETSGVALTVETTGEPTPLLPDLEVALYRVAQEALANVGKHAGASRVGLTLSYMDDVVVLDVRDDGSGYDPATYRGPVGGSGFGLAAMEQRLRRVSGRWEIESAPGEGTAVSASVPAIPAQEQAEE
ncbi:sensor histidine kinase [Pseudonocardia sp. CA-107938]|uniref:sensor histidine kinase n=1 Tax=Pseudonocardia sp. CA-107938 TaxID=3240021 RepID=UPI003D8C8B00